ncbi:MAG: aspartyl protease family protein [Deltaproteobacteria bacterium]|nr:aspartyl protease family protein [Deltaproteobacteria bacterium]
MLLLGVLGCGPDDDGFHYEGTPGTATQASYSGSVPQVMLRINEVHEGAFIVDTGSPVTLLDKSTFAGFSDGIHEVTVQGFGLVFPSTKVLALDIFAADGGAGAYGLLGGDILRHFALSLDYKQGKAWLSDPLDPAAVYSPAEAELPAGVPVEIRGGGLSRACLPPKDCGVIRLAPTRVLLTATFEGLQPVTVLVDTGASAVVLSSSFFETLSARTPGRPTLAGITVEGVAGPLNALWSRTYRIRLGSEGDAVSLDDVPVLVLPGSGLLGNLSDEVGRQVHALIGGTVLRHFITTVDYLEGALRLGRYKNPSHVPAQEFVGVGFEMHPRGTDWVIVSVYPGTDAAAEGLATGDLVLDVGSTSITGQPPDVVKGLMDDYGLGQDVPLGISRGGSPVEKKMVRVEDLLPSFPPPP